MRARSRTPPIPLGEYRCVLVNCGFATVLATSKLAGLQHLGHIMGEGQYYGSPKSQLSEANYLAVVLCQSWAMLRRKLLHTLATVGEGWHRWQRV
jgi:hypothetical protein